MTNGFAAHWESKSQFFRKIKIQRKPNSAQNLPDAAPKFQAPSQLKMH
jgi:hypothetical protein